MAETTTEILESVKDRASIPDGDPILTDAKLLKWLDDETLSFLVPLLIAKKEQHLIKSSDTVFTANLARYRIPERAYGAKLAGVQVVAADGKIRDLAWREPRDVISNTATGKPTEFYVENDEVVVYPTPADATETLRLRHYRRPNALVAASSVTTVVSVTSSTIVLTSAVGFGTTAADYDIIRGKDPHDWVAIDKSATRSSTTLTFSSFNPSSAGVVTGDYVALAKQTCVPNLPRDLVPILCELGALRYARSQGDFEAVQASLQILAMMLGNSSEMLGPRVDQAIQKLTSTLARSTRPRFSTED